MGIPKGSEKRNFASEEKEFIPFVQFVLIWVSIFLILHGWEKKDLTVSIVGACIFMTVLLFDLYRACKLSKKYVKMREDGIDNYDVKENSFSNIVSFFEGIIILGSFIGILVFQGKEEIYLYPCIIIGLGAILAYFFSGVIVREITNTSLWFGYGGWKIRYHKRRRR